MKCKGSTDAAGMQEHANTATKHAVTSSIQVESDKSVQWPSMDTRVETHNGADKGTKTSPDTRR